MATIERVYEVIDRPSQNASIASYPTRKQAEAYAHRLNWAWWKEWFFVMALVLFLLQGGEPYAIVARDNVWPDED